MCLIAPHLRRAVTIGDLLDMARLEAGALKGVVDDLSVGIGIVAADGTVLHANRTAREMLASADGPIRSVGGRLAGRRASATEELAVAISASVRTEASLGRAGSGVVLDDAVSGGTPAVAHVLPLAGGEALAEARATLGIAETTAKTHMARIFAKAGVSRQQDLVALVARLASPLRGR